jgi:hypothetical protein
MPLHRTSEYLQFKLAGLAGWQYREFFSVLLPLYAEVNVEGAAGLRDAVLADSAKKAAVDRLGSLYHDEELMSRMPIEL